MRKLLSVAAIATASALALPGAASAAVCIDGGLTCTFVPGDPEFQTAGDTTFPIDQVVTATIGRPGVPAGDFTDTYQFIVDADGFGSGSLNTSFSGPGSTLTFTSVTFNGTLLDLSQVLSPDGINGLPIFAGALNQLVIRGTSSELAPYGGTITFTPGAIPEPGTWAMMLMGFGGLGYVMRRRRNTEAKVSFA